MITLWALTSRKKYRDVVFLKSSSNKFEETTLNREGDFQIQEKDNTEIKMKDKKVGKVSKEDVSFGEIR